MGETGAVRRGHERLDSSRRSSLPADVLDVAPDALLVLDSACQIKWGNRAASNLFRIAPEPVAGRSLAEFLHADCLERLRNMGAQMGSPDVGRQTIRAIDARGHSLFVDIAVWGSVPGLPIDGHMMSLRPVQAGAASREVEQSIARVQRSIERSQRFSWATLDSITAGIVSSYPSGTIRLLNRAAREMFAIDPSRPGSLVRLSELCLVDPSGRPTNVEEIGDTIAPGVWTVTGSGPVQFVEVGSCQVTAENGAELGRVLVFSDVTATHKAAEELRVQALHDQLTGLPNRRQLEERMIEMARRGAGSTVAACFIDLDGFKLVNDNFGHRTGDQLVRIAAERLVRELRPGDLLARQGGDEFVALLTEVESMEEAMAVAERLRSALARTFSIGDRRFDLSASVGVTLGRLGHTSGSALLAQSDIALYAAKNRGRNRVEAFTDTLAQAARLEAERRRLVRRALDEEQFVVQFQPIVAASGDRVAGFEALARVRADNGSLVTPGGFMDAIDNTNLMWELDRRAFKLACDAARHFAEIQPTDPPFVSANFSAISLNQSDFVPTLKGIADAAQVPPERLWIELAECDELRVSSPSAPKLCELADLGFRICLDDFGAGYSSLSHLRDLPISTIKVGTTFVGKLDNPTTERVIAVAIVALAAQLGVPAVAEGVETAEQLAEARAVGFHNIQGWYYAPALDLPAALAALAEGGILSGQTAVRPDATQRV